MKGDMTMMTRMMIASVAVLAVLVLGACKSEKKAPLPKSGLPDTYHLAAAPTGVRKVPEIKANAKDGEQVVIAGIVGGAKEPFVDGAAVFTIVDASVDNKCTKEADHCPTPWDYCCEPPQSLLDNKLTIEFRDGASPHKTSVRGFHGIDYLKKVVVAGEAKRDAQGNVVVVASGVYVE